MEAYTEEFIQLSNQVPGLQEEHYLGYFMNGLSEFIRVNLRVLDPRDLEVAMQMAHIM